MELQLRDGEYVVRNLDPEEGYHVILHGEKIEWLKAAYRTKLFRTPLLTNYRLVFLKENENDVDYDVPLQDIEKIDYEGGVLGMNPRIKLILMDGSLLQVVFESISSRVYLGAAWEAAGAQRLSKEWKEAIDNERRKANATVEAFLAPPAPTEYIPACHRCGQPLTFLPSYSRWYCYNCKKYV